MYKCDMIFDYLATITTAAVALCTRNVRA